MKKIDLFKKSQSTIIKRFDEQNLRGAKEYAFFMRRITDKTQGEALIEKCSIESLQSVALQIADLGLSLNPAANYIYIIPYKDTATLQLSYKGLLYLVRRANKNITIIADVVYKGDVYSKKIDTSNSPEAVRIIYEQGENYGDISKIRGAFCMWKLNATTTWDAVYMSKAQLEAARAQSKSPNSPAWRNFTDEMYKKVVLRRAIKAMPIVPPELPEDETVIEDVNTDTEKFADFEEIEVEGNEKDTKKQSKEDLKMKNPISNTKKQSNGKKNNI